MEDILKILLKFFIAFLETASLDKAGRVLAHHLLWKIGWISLKVMTFGYLPNQPFKHSDDVGNTTTSVVCGVGLGVILLTSYFVIPII